MKALVKANGATINSASLTVRAQQLSDVGGCIVQHYRGPPVRRWCARAK